MSQALRKKAEEIVDKLDKAYPEARQELNFSNAFELLIATILAAQCTDARVNQVTEKLFVKYPNPVSFVAVERSELIDDLAGISFAGNKSKFIQNTCTMIVDDFDGQVPESVADLVKLQGVGRKTANIVRANAMGIPAIGVDTHTIRVPNRLGLIEEKDPNKIEAALCDLLPEPKWHRGNIVLQWHGRYTCKAKKPNCKECVIFSLCEWEEKQLFN